MPPIRQRPVTPGSALSAIRIFTARRIVTMNKSAPEATHVAVRDGRILGYGDAAAVAGFGNGEIDHRFADKVILPGFVEGHCHLFEGALWQDPYLGYFDRRGPDGRLWPGLKSIDAVVDRLRQHEAALGDPGAPVTGWGFDPIFFAGRRMHRGDLDRVSTRRAVLILHASGHIMNANSVVLERAGYSADSNLDGLVRDDHGELTGELQGPLLMQRAARVVGGFLATRALDADAVRRFGEVARRVGVTTASDLHNDLSEDTVLALRQATGKESFPLRIAPALASRARPLADSVARYRELLGTGNAKLHFGLVKLVVDGSIQGFTARLRWPGYHNGAENGLWYIAPTELPEIVETWHRAGARLHMHTNGDEATELAIAAVERALAALPRPDHRYTLQHCQMADEAQFRRIKALGMCVNLFANHLYYWGDQHYELTMGPARAARLDACGTALRQGVPLAIHCDAPVTPIAPLFTAWCAVNRQSASGRLLGEAERIDVASALHAVTLGPAYTLGLDHLVGSIDVGKFADFAVLDEDPFEVAPAALKDIRVAATVLGGTVFPVAD
jgi:predicted amidohydrolase YtcJ